MVLPFEPMTMTFKDLHYWVEIPKVTTALGLAWHSYMKRLEDITASAYWCTTSATFLQHSTRCIPFCSPVYTFASGLDMRLSAVGH